MVAPGARAELQRRDLLSHDGHTRLVAVPPGVLAGNLLGLGPAVLSVSALAAYAVAWLVPGRLLLRRS